MSTSLKSIIDEFSPEDQAFIQKRADVLAQDMVQHADSLAEVRNAFVKTQQEVAHVLNIKQNAVAQLEKRSDLLISTLRKYVEAMGGELALAIKTGAGTVIMLDQLSSISRVPGLLPELSIAGRQQTTRPSATKRRAGKPKTANAKTLSA